MPVIEDITEEEEVPKHEILEDRPPEGDKSENKFPIEDQAEVESDSEDFFDASELTPVQQWQFISDNLESNILKAVLCKDDGNKYFKDDKLLEAESEYLKGLDYLPTKEWPDPN